MGKVNAVLKHYCSDRRKFADLFNGILFNGEEVIHFNELLEGSEVYSEPDEPEDTDEHRQYIERTRDMKMISAGGTAFCIYAIENQNSVDYSMPLRCMQYDVMQYQKQLQEIKRKNEATGDYGNGAEKLCQVKKRDRLWPTYTVCIYLGEDKWDGPRCLKDMMDFGDVSERVKEQFADYQFRLFCVNEEQDFSVFHTSVRLVFELMPYRKSKKKLLEKLEENALYEKMDAESLELLSVLLNVPTIWKNREKYMKKTEDKEEYNMCQASRELIEDGKLEGRAEGRAEGKIDMLFELVRDGLLSLENAAKKANFTVDEFKKRMSSTN